MPFHLHEIVPWGRSFDEYIAMFPLSEKDLKAKILDCGERLSSFTCTLSGLGGQVTSCDPLYQFSPQEIEIRIDDTLNKVIEQTRSNIDEFIWTRITSVKELSAMQMSAMMQFLADYKGEHDVRYVPASLPSLPFKDMEFNIALCSHLIFLYSEKLSLDFHISSLLELCRVAAEARIFPLLELDGQKSRHLSDVITELQINGFSVEINKVAYEFQKGGNEMLKITRA